jgi:endonuclease/exonuclease/phosphatase (EEP) superfamily protein YafD
MRSRLQWIHGRGEHVIVERQQTYRAEIFVKFLVLVGLLYMPVLIFHWGEWIPFAGASIYLLWELGRINSALGELADLWNEQYQQRQESARDASLQ